MEVLQLYLLVPVEGVECGKFTAEDCRVIKTVEIDMDIDIFLNCNWVDARWH